MAKTYFGNGTPFSRVLDYQERSNALLCAGTTPMGVLFLLRGEYTSRGHGKARNTGMTVTKAHRFGRSKYAPHQGKQEIARRAHG